MIFFIFSFIFWGCGKSDVQESEESCPVCLGQGQVIHAADGKISIHLQNIAPQQDFIVMPFALGNTANIDGANIERNTFQFTQLELHNQVALQNQLPRFRNDSFLVQERIRRLPWNQWDPQRMHLMSDEFWPIVRRADESTKKSLHLNHSSKGLEKMFRNTIAAKTTANVMKIQNNMSTNTSMCPESIAVPAIIDSQIKSRQVAVGGFVTEGDNYCLVYVKGNGNSSVESAAKIKAAVDRAWATYMDIIYKGESFVKKGTYEFKPIIAVLPFDDATYWDANSALKVFGIFSRATSTEMKRPMIYMATDLNAVLEQGRSMNADLSARTFYATLAHEFHHAIVDWFKSRSDLLPETVNIDEGLAQLMEDIFGYGDLAFAEMIGGFLGEFFIIQRPVLSAGMEKVSNFVPDDDTGNDAAPNRGAAQALLYYLASQAGADPEKSTIKAFNYSDDSGALIGGPGIEFIRALVTNQNSGVPNLVEISKAKTSEKNWINTMGNFFGAVALHGLGIEKVLTQYRAQDPITGILDLEGKKNSQAKFGVKFADPSLFEREYQNISDPLFKDLSLPFYTTMPALLRSTGSSWRGEVITASDNAAAVIVRVK